jgi:trimeric autotransporter adhesin
MSTKTLRKRIALVAVATLGAGLLSVAPASANTGTSIVSPVRVTFTGTTQDTVRPSAVTITAGSLAVANAVAAATAGTRLLNTIALTTAPTSAAVLAIAQANVLDQAGTPASLAVTASNTGSTGGVTLAQSQTLTAASTAEAIATSQAISGITFAANVAGTYAGTITTVQASGNALVTPFRFTTTGVPTSIDFTSATTSSAVSGTINVTVTLRDAAGNVTQPATVDSVALTAEAGVSGNNAGSFATPTSSSAGVFITTAGATDSLHDGTGTLAYTNSSVSGATTTLTATPRGTLGTIAAKTLTVTTVSANVGVPTATIATSNTTIRATTSTSVLNKYTVSTNQTSVTFNVTGLTPSSSFSYDVTASTGSFTSVNALAYSSGADLVGVSTATGTFSIVVVAASPSTQTITLDLNTAGTTDVAGQVNADYTYATGAYAVTVTTPAATPLFATSSAITYTGRVADQFGNVLAGASILATGTPTPATTPATITATAVTAADGTFSVTLPAVAATTTSLSTVVSATASVSVSSAAANVAYFTASGVAATLVLTDSDTPNAVTGVTTTDNRSSRTVPLGRATTAGDMSDLIDTEAATTDNVVSITPQTTSPASVGYSVTATNGIRLFTADQNGALGLANTAAITGTGGTAFFAVPTRAGAGVITVVSGGLTQTFTLTGLVAAAPRANLVSLAAGTVAGSYIVTATDAFGNGVAADVAISVAGPGAFSNGFKNLTVTTAAANGQNTFSIVSDGSAPTVITASIAGASNYTAITAAEVTTYALVAASAAATATSSDAVGNSIADTAQAAVDAAAEATDAANAATDAANAAAEAADAATAAAQDAADAVAALSTQVTELVTALRRQITSLTNLVIKIQKKVRA